MTSGLHGVDFLIVAVYAFAMLWLGWYCSGRQTSTREYFLGGGASNPFLIGVSLFATVLSTITYLSSPGEIIRNGPYLLAGLVASPIAFCIIGYLLIPVYMHYRVTSAYELLEARLGLGSRLMGAIMFISLRMMWMAVLLNFASNAFLVMIGWEREWLLPVTAVIGGVALFYSSIGGLRAVVITDFFQAVLLFGGAITVMVTVTYQVGGFGWFPRTWDPGWKRQPFFSLDPHVRLSIVGLVVSQILWSVSTYGGDQTAVQRFMATRDAKAARRSMLTTTVAAMLINLVLPCVGLALLGFYRAFPEHLPAEATVTSAADRLFPHYIATQLAPGIAGLVVSGMFAAAMSSVDSGINSISAVIHTDFLKRFYRPNRAVELGGLGTTESPFESDRESVRIAKLTALAVGLFMIATCGIIEHVPGNLLEASKRVLDLLVTPLVSLFFFALFVPFATQAGANAGAICGFATAIVFSFWNPLFSDRSISFTWIGPAAFSTAVVVGCIVSWVTRNSGRDRPAA